MIDIYFNGEKVTLSAKMSLSDFLKHQKTEEGCFAIAINRNFIPKSHYNKKIIQMGDRIECVTPMQGG